MADIFYDPKDPLDQGTYSVNFALDLAQGETISSCACSSTTINGLTSTLAVNPTANVSGTTVSTFISGGQANQEYQVTFKVSTSLGNTINRSVLLPVQNR